MESPFITGVSSILFCDCTKKGRNRKVNLKKRAIMSQFYGECRKKTQNSLFKCIILSAKQECIGMTDKNRQKLEMFENRLRKVIKIRSKAARKQNVTCFRVYDLDMPEFPFCIDWYDGRIYVAEYQRQHTLDENQYKEWFENSIQTIAGVFAVEPTMIFVKHRKVIEERVA